MDTIPQDEPRKQCNRCTQFLPLTSYTKDSYKDDGLRTICKVCTKTPKPIPPPVPEGYKRCRDCEQILLATTDFFNKTALYQSPDGLNKQCIECRKASRKERDRSKPPVPKPRQELKQCDDCELFFPPDLKHFSINRSTGDRLNTVCKPCAKIRSRNYRNREGGKEARRAYRQARSEHDKQYHRTYHVIHRERESQYRKWYRQTHREQERARHRNYRQSHQAQSRARVLNRIARKKAAPGTHTPQEIREQYRRQKGRCYYCRNKVRWGEHHVDHTFPLSRENTRNSIDHLVITCKPCNLSKGNKYPWEWAAGGRLL